MSKTTRDGDKRFRRQVSSWNCCWLFLFILIAGCSEKLPPTSYFNFFNSFQQDSYIASELAGFNYKLQKRTPAFQALNYLKGSGQISKLRIDRNIDSFSDPDLYCLRISAEDLQSDVLSFGITDEAQLYHRIELLNKDFGQMIRAISATDTLYPSTHHFERTYKLRPFVTISVSFNNPDGKAIDRIILEDHVFNEGKIVVFDHIQSYNQNLPNLEI